MPKVYVCNKWPFLSVGESIKFDTGIYRAKNEAEEAQIEKLESYGVQIHDRDTKAEVDALKAAEKAIFKNEPPKKPVPSTGNVQSEPNRPFNDLPKYQLPVPPESKPDEGGVTQGRKGTK